MIDDNIITIKQIAESFNTKGNSFGRKPKIFLFQTCQGAQSAKSNKDDEEKDIPIQSQPNKHNEELVIKQFIHEHKCKEITTNQNVDDEINVEEVEEPIGSVPIGLDIFMGFANSQVLCHTVVPQMGVVSFRPLQQLFMMRSFHDQEQKK